MGIELIRVDDRLIHGQVAIGWTRSRGINTIIVIDDATAIDRMQCQLMKMATPPGVKAYFFGVDDAVEKILNGALNNKKAMLLVKGPVELKALIDKGIAINEVNIGNQRSGDNKIQLASQMFATLVEIDIWKSISQRNIKLYAQGVPGGANTNINDALTKYE